MHMSAYSITIFIWFCIIDKVVTQNSTVTCRTCVESRKECLSEKYEKGCDFCLLLRGTVTDPQMLPDYVVSFVREAYPKLKLIKGQPVVARACMTKDFIERYTDFDAEVGCKTFDPLDCGFKGEGCFCKNDCKKFP